MEGWGAWPGRGAQLVSRRARQVRISPGCRPLADRARGEERQETTFSITCTKASCYKLHMCILYNSAVYAGHVYNPGLYAGVGFS